MIWTWQENAGIPELTYMRWNSSHQQTEILYNRLAYNITLCNFFLDQIAGKEDATSVQQRAEARFLRSLFYYYLMDTFGKAPSPNTSPKRILLKRRPPNCSLILKANWKASKMI